MRSDPERAKRLDCLFALLGSACVKAACKMSAKFIRREKDAGIKNDCDILRLKWFSQLTKADDATQD